MKTTLKNLSVALMLAGMTIGSGAVAAEKYVIAHPWRQRLSAGAYATGESDGVCARGRLSGTGFSDDKGRPSGRPP